MQLYKLVGAHKIAIAGFVDLVGMVGAAGIAVYELITDIHSQQNAVKDAAATKPVSFYKPKDIVLVKKGPKDLAKEGRDAIAKREAAKANAAKKQAQTAQGKPRKEKVIKTGQVRTTLVEGTKVNMIKRLNGGKLIRNVIHRRHHQHLPSRHRLGGIK